MKLIKFEKLLNAYQIRNDDFKENLGIVYINPQKVTTIEPFKGYVDIWIGEESHTVKGDIEEIAQKLQQATALDSIADTLLDISFNAEYNAREELKAQNTVKSILDWFKLAKPNPQIKDTLVQMGCHFEEVLEMTEALKISFPELNELAEQLKTAHKEGSLSDIKEFMYGMDKEQLLDALCDQIVTALGVGYMLGFDMEKALAEVNRSNYSKFENGKPVFDKNGKIKKGANYSEPNLKPFIKED